MVLIRSAFQKFIIVCLIVFTTVFNAYAYDYQQGAKNWDTWAGCTIDEQCMPIHDECGGWIGVNKKFEQEGTQYQDELAAAAKCAYTKMTPPPKVLCLQQVCTVKPGLDNEGNT